MVMRAMGKLLQPLRRRISSIVTRAVLTLVDDDALMQTVQARLLADETLDGLERFQAYGFSAVPHPGAEAIALSVGGLRSHTVIVAVDDRRHRPTGLQGGEAAVYTDEDAAGGMRIHLRRNRVIEILADQVVIKADTLVRVETPELQVTGEIKDRCDSDGRTMADMRSIYNDHVHDENDNGGPTATPSQEM